MICPDCAVSNDQSARYCQGCGRSFLQDQTSRFGETAKRSAEATADWSIWSIASAILLVLECLMLPVMFVQSLRALIGLVFIVIISIISVTCGQLALVEISYTKRNRASFWIAVISLCIGYFVLLGSFVATMLFTYILANWN